MDAEQMIASTCTTLTQSNITSAGRHKKLWHHKRVITCEAPVTIYRLVYGFSRLYM